jgi:uncharacterized protein with HEPN domain
VPSNQWSGKSIGTRARDVLIAIARIHEYVAGLDQQGFAGDQKTQSAVERELLTISEACRKIADLESKQDVAPKNRLVTRFPKVPWSEIRGIGNILRHEYGRVDPDVIWSTVKGDDLQNLRSALVSAFPDLST